MNIFGRSAFSNKKEPDSSMTLKPGERILRYRGVIHPGTFADAPMDDLYKAYAQHERK